MLGHHDFFFLSLHASVNGNLFLFPSSSLPPFKLFLPFLASISLFLLSPVFSPSWYTPFFIASIPILPFLFPSSPPTFKDRLCRLVFTIWPLSRTHIPIQTYHPVSQPNISVSSDCNKLARIFIFWRISSQKCLIVWFPTHLLKTCSTM